jgi:SAM-dependent methyltransferase
MSDEVRSSSVPNQADPGELDSVLEEAVLEEAVLEDAALKEAARRERAVDEPAAEDVSAAAPEGAAVLEDAAGSEDAAESAGAAASEGPQSVPVPDVPLSTRSLADSERPTNPLPIEPLSLEPLSEPEPQVVPPARAPEPPRISERPPPPSQRSSARLAAAAAAAAAAALPAPSAVGGFPPPIVGPPPVPPPPPLPEPEPATGRSITPPPISVPISVSTSLAPTARRSEPVPLVQHRTLSSVAPAAPPHLRSSAPPRVSSLPPGLVEPKRIIEVLGSNVPVLDNQLEEEIEDLDESEAYELSDTAEAAAAAAAAELEVAVDFDTSPFDEESEQDHDPGGVAEAHAAGGSVDTAGDHAPGHARPPPKKRRRPPPPSARATEKVAEKSAPEAAPGVRKWWEEMFSEEFLRAIPILSPRQLEREVTFIEESLAVAPGGRILDLACGAGQHAVELASRSYDLVGYDLSQSQLDWAWGLAQERGQRLQFTHGDMRELAYQESFDAIYSWNTSFGFFEEEKNVDVAQRVFKALRPGGRFLLDVINRDFVVAQQPGQTWFEGDGCVCIDDVTIDFITSRMKVKRTLMLTNGKNRECTYSVRIYGLHELGKILHDVGFKILKVSGGPEMPGVFFGSVSPRVIILAGKPPC